MAVHFSCLGDSCCFCYFFCQNDRSLNVHNTGLARYDLGWSSPGSPFLSMLCIFFLSFGKWWKLPLKLHLLELLLVHSTTTQKTMMELRTTSGCDSSSSLRALGYSIAAHCCAAVGSTGDRPTWRHTLCSLAGWAEQITFVNAQLQSLQKWLFSLHKANVYVGMGSLRYRLWIHGVKRRYFA